MKKILITGANGQVGWELQQSCRSVGQVIALDRSHLDLTKENEISDIIQRIRPDYIINAAAYTAVDKAEGEQELCYQINAKAPAIMAEEAKKINAEFIHYSTDYVFDGAKLSPYSETDAVNPINFYGQSKLDGEKFIQQIDGQYLIFRISWVYGARGHNFFRTMVRLMQEREELKVVTDQIGAPTWSRMVAEATVQLLIKNETVKKKGLYHLTPDGSTSWYGFALHILESLKKQGIAVKTKNIIPISSAEYPTPAKRPKNSRLSSQKVHADFDVTYPTWDYFYSLQIEP